ncbi:MAG: IS3 family transposase [Gemmatimonadota bacterium]|nr:IS3 family transposase [Gemmatimonadota bacterium]
MQEIRTVLKASPFLGEGHRKVRARLAARGIRVGKNRVLRLMRAHELLAPVRRGHPRGDKTHSGQIRTERPDELWGTDASRFWTKAEGWCWFFGAVNHCASDVVGWHVAKKGDRWAALEPVRQGVRAHMGGFGKGDRPGSGSGTTGVRSTGPGSSRPRSSGSASAPHPPTWASRSATASRSASSGRSRRSASICTISRPSREAGAVIAAFIDNYNNGWLR